MILEAVASVILAAGSAAGAETAVETPVEAALRRSVAFCDFSVAGTGTLEGGFELYMKLPAAMRRNGIRTTADVPELIHRFAATSPAARVGWSGDFMRLASSEGAVWGIASSSMPMCDVAITGLAQAPQPPTALVERLQAEGWSVLARQGLEDEAPLWTFVLQRPAPSEDAANRVVRMTVTGLRLGASPDGIQIEMNVIAGEVRPS